MKETRNTDFLLSLAPMAGYTDCGFRLVCQEYGAEETVTEMVSARALYHGDKKSKRLMHLDPLERGVTVQIFGSEPEIMAEAVREQINPYGAFSGIDINMGCPVPKIVKNGEGAALMRDEDLALRVTEAVVEASAVPVSVKIRLGWDFSSMNFVSLGKKLAQTGIHRITLHARTRSQFYTGSADWEKVKELAAELPVPVIGNGDIADAEADLARIRESGVQGVAIGRGAVGNPWIFEQIARAMRGEEIRELTAEEKVHIALRQLTLTCERKGEALGVVQMRKHLLQYVKGWKGASALKQEILEQTTEEGVRRVFEAYLSS